MYNKKYWNDLENLPLKESNSYYKYRKYKYKLKYNKYRNSKSHWKILDRVLKNNIGKSFDLAFHYFCTKVKKEYQHIFLDKFKKEYYRRRFYSEWGVDENGNIVYIPHQPQASKKVTFYSDDYKAEIYYKGTNIKQSQYHLKFSWKKYHEATHNNMWEARVISGWSKEYSSKNDPEYKRLRNAQLKKKELIYKKEQSAKILTEDKIRQLFHEGRERIQKQQKELQKEELIYQQFLIQEKLENEVKIESHGFDSKLSFRKHKRRKEI